MNKKKKQELKTGKFSTKEHTIYLKKMTILWLGFTIAQVILIILIVPYLEKIDKTLKENLGSFLVYIAIIIGWSIYRLGSRLKYKNTPNFQEKLLKDFSFAKKFNNSEIIKMIISYFLFAIPIFYTFNIAQNILNYFGYKSSGFGGDIQHLMISFISSIFTLVSGILGAYLYDKIKHKLP